MQLGRLAPSAPSSSCGLANAWSRVPAAWQPRRCACAASQAMAPSVVVEFSKYQGLGNDFILVDNRHTDEPLVSQQQAVQLCDRNFGIGADGVILALPPIGSMHLTMRIFNSDGSEPEMCGNGIRCLAKFVAQRDASGAGELQTKYRIHTLAGLIQPELLPDGQVCVDMGAPTLNGPQVPTTLAPTREGGAVVQQDLQVAGRTYQVTTVSMGNPHALIYSVDGAPVELDSVDLSALGPQFESHPVFPARTNTEFVQVLDRQHVRMAVWERGAGRTLACGTGACAVVVAGVLEGRVERSCRVDLPGGPLQIEWREADDHVYMTGPAELVFTGTVALAAQ